MKTVQIVTQIVILIAISALGNAIQTRLHLEIPGGIIGLVILYLCIELGWMNMERVAQGADFLISELLLFFIPSAVGVMQFGSLMEQKGVVFLAIIVLSTVLVLASVAFQSKEMREDISEGEGKS